MYSLFMNIYRIFGQIQKQRGEGGGSIFRMDVYNRGTTDKCRTLTCFCSLSMLFSLLLCNKKCLLNRRELLFQETHFRSKNKTKKCMSFYLEGGVNPPVIFEVYDERFLKHTFFLVILQNNSLQEINMIGIIY